MADSTDEGTLVAKGKHVVPNGVAVEELDGGAKKLANQCPAELARLLESREGARLVYDQFVAAVTETGKTRSVLGNWKDAELDSVLDLFRDEFAQFGIKVALCKRSSASSTHRWLEFIDTSVLPGYVPQYDVANTSGQTIKTVYDTLEFPVGVAVEELKQWKGREKLRDKIPVYVERMLTEKDLMTEYDMLVQRCIEDGVGRKMKNWKNKKLVEVLAEFKPLFQAKGVDIFICHKEEWVSQGESGGHNEHFRWVEFVDREKQPNYHPQRDATTRKEDQCSIM